MPEPSWRFANASNYRYTKPNPISLQQQIINFMNKNKWITFFILIIISLIIYFIITSYNSD